jgi:hypothetical protein
VKDGQRHGFGVIRVINRIGGVRPEVRHVVSFFAQLDHNAGFQGYTRMV